jgi:drug/metabolite transporter (DMT)-like permease
VWSSGYISGPAAVHAAAPFSVLGWRFVLAALLGAGLALAMRRPTRMDRATVGRVALVGLVMNGLQFGLMYVAFDLGLGATLASLFHALSPVLTAILAAGLLGERVSVLQVAGFVVGVVGVLLVLGADLGRAGGPVAVLIGCLSMLTLSLGTLGQGGSAPSPTCCGRRRSSSRCPLPRCWSWAGRRRACGPSRTPRRRWSPCCSWRS